MYDEQVNRLRNLAGMIPHKHTLPSGADTVICSLEAFMQIKELAGEAADAIENLNCQRERAYASLCEWCGVCPEGKRNPEDCEIAALNPEPPKEEAKNFCVDCHWHEIEEQYCFRKGCHAYDESSCELWEPMPADEPIPAPGGKTDPTTYDLLYEEGGYSGNGI